MILKIGRLPLRSSSWRPWIPTSKCYGCGFNLRVRSTVVSAFVSFLNIRQVPSSTLNCQNLTSISLTIVPARRSSPWSNTSKRASCDKFRVHLPTSFVRLLSQRISRLPALDMLSPALRSRVCPCVVALCQQLLTNLLFSPFQRHRYLSEL